MIDTNDWYIGKVLTVNSQTFWVVDKIEYKEYNCVKWVIEFLN